MRSNLIYRRFTRFDAEATPDFSRFSKLFALLTIPIPFANCRTAARFFGNAWIFYSFSPAGNAGAIGRCCSEMADQRRKMYVLTA
jgi:hypothetical protein